MIHRTFQTEIGQLRSVILKTASHAFHTQKKIAQEWKVLNYLNEPILVEAEQEYDAFQSIFTELNVDIHFLLPESDLTLDSLYCRDAAIMTDHGAILCAMGKPERHSEPAAIKRLLEKAGIPILVEMPRGATIEGGDVAWLDPQTVAVGHSYRTNLQAINFIRELLSAYKIEVITVELPHFRGPNDVFHLMSIFSPVANDLAVVYSPLMPIAFRDLLLARNYKLVEVPENEFESLGCNVLAISPANCVMLEGNPITQGGLIALGCDVKTIRGRHICLPGGGGPTCLTRPLHRSLEI